MTINYQTKSNIKKESTRLVTTGKNKVTYYSNGVGKKSKITVKKTGYVDATNGFSTYIIKNQKVNIKTTNKKYKIKTVQLIYRDMGDKVSKTTTFNVNGKTSFTKTIKGKFYTTEFSLTEFKITYY
jgi:hypothetical protein